MHWDVALAKHIGGRGEQQDHVGATLSEDRRTGLLALADGMGGHRGGALASRTVVQAAESVWAKLPSGPVDPQAVLMDACGDAHRRILELGRQHSLDPHTTCVLLFLQPTLATWLHVGDSRCYHVRGSAVVGRTRDHSVVQLLVDLNEVRESEMGQHPDQNKLLRSLGSGTALEPEVGSSAIREGDGFVLCSDGLWETVSPAEMAQALSAQVLQAEAERLVELAAERGGPEGDNVSLILARAVAGEANGAGGAGPVGSMVDRLKRMVR